MHKMSDLKRKQRNQFNFHVRFDILSDEEVRQELKTFSNWPTYPQVYVKGELIGGLDILKEMVIKNHAITINN